MKMKLGWGELGGRPSPEKGNKEKKINADDSLAHP